MTGVSKLYQLTARRTCNFYVTGLSGVAGMYVITKWLSINCVIGSVCVLK
jgi:hypothetical protein